MGRVPSKKQNRRNSHVLRAVGTGSRVGRREYVGVSAYAWDFQPGHGSTSRVWRAHEANPTHLGIFERLGQSMRSGYEETPDEGKATFESRQYS